MAENAPVHDEPQSATSPGAIVTDEVKSLQTDTKIGDKFEINVPNFSCDNVRQFKESLKSLRMLDDKIVYKLNASVPTKSFEHEVDAQSKCQTLYKNLLEIYRTRDEAIKGCIATRNEQIDRLKMELKVNGESKDLMKQLRSEQTLLKFMQSEIIVEEVVKKRSIKVFNERCWKAYTPPS